MRSAFVMAALALTSAQAAVQNSSPPRPVYRCRPSVRAPMSFGTPRSVFLVALLALTLAVPATSARAQSDDDRYDIMRPEKPLAKKPPPVDKHKVRRGSSSPVYPTPLPPPLHYNPQPSQSVVTHPAPVPPPLYVPQTGQTLPNLPAVAPSGPKGTESYQDRAVRCAHQAGVYGQAAGDRNSYIGSCISQ
jgi:hypothetical protein